MTRQLEDYQIQNKPGVKTIQIFSGDEDQLLYSTSGYLDQLYVDVIAIIVMIAVLNYLISRNVILVMLVAVSNIVGFFSMRSVRELGILLLINGLFLVSMFSRRGIIDANRVGTVADMLIFLISFSSVKTIQYIVPSLYSAFSNLDQL